MNLFSGSPDSNSINSLGVLKLQFKRLDKEKNPTTKLRLIQWNDSSSETSVKCNTKLVPQNHSEIILVNIDKTGNLAVIWNNKTVNFSCTKNTGSIWPGVTELQTDVSLVSWKYYEGDESYEPLEDFFSFHYELLRKPSKH